MRFIIILLLFFSILLADNHDENKQYHYYNKDLTYLNLTNIQKDKVKDILKNYQKDTKDFRKYKGKMISQKEDLFAKNNLDEKKLKKISEKISNIEINIEIKLLKQIHQVLTIKQRKKFAHYMNEWDLE